jgi:hypothetical protein
MHSAQYKYNVHVWEAKRLKVSKKKKDNLWDKDTGSNM